MITLDGENFIPEYSDAFDDLIAEKYVSNTGYDYNGSTRRWGFDLKYNDATATTKGDYVRSGRP